MRLLRELRKDVWYEIHTRINNREPLFRRRDALVVFAQALRQAAARFGFVLYGLQMVDDRLRFYIKPADGFELPKIMKWIKQVFAQRFNRLVGRIGHIWGDRYWSRVVEGEPEDMPSVEATPGSALSGDIRVRPQYRERVVLSLFSRFFLCSGVHPPG
ncbi:MAG: transposase [Treponema sp.]|nr:transposase [Treponema sp.]